MDSRKNKFFFRSAMQLMTLDLWLLLNTRRMVNFLTKILGFLIQIISIMALGAGVLIAYTLVHVKIDMSTYHEEHPYGKVVKSSDEGLIGIATTSTESNLLLKHELASLKNQALSIEMSLIKMKNQYKDLSNIALSTRKDHELPDFASEAAGGAVLDTPDTESYHKPDHQQITFFGIPIWEAGYFTPRKVIQPWTQAGECWAFRGSNGKILLKLARAAYIDKVTLEHIPVSASLTGSINSAPRDFSVHAVIEHGLRTLDSFTYDINGQPSQTFVLMDKEVKKLYPVETILLEIQSNWGHPDFTCIYRFRVHGKIASRQKNGHDFEIGDED